MIPMFQAKEEELTLKFEKIKNVRDELEAFKEEHGIKLRYVRPLGTTSFMVRAGVTANQNKDYILQNKQKFQSKTEAMPASGKRSLSSIAKKVTSDALNKDLNEIS
jgi:hypothetical protein